MPDEGAPELRVWPEVWGDIDLGEVFDVEDREGD